MLVVFGGFLGSGRKRLAREFSERTGFYYYDVDTKLMTEFHWNDGKVREHKRRVVSDQMRVQLFRQVLADFQKLSKMYPDMVIDSPFHRKKSREFFLEEAKEYFDRVEFTWIDADEKDVSERLERMVSKGVIASTEEGVHRREREVRGFEPFTDEPRRFTYRGGDTNAVDALIAMMRVPLR
jgi:predicted kinase